MRQPFWPNDSASRPIAIAHRGGDGAGRSQENTMAAFRAARKMGYRYLETDVVLTADGQVIAIHGAENRLDSLFRRRPLRRRLQEMTYQQIVKRLGGVKAPPRIEDALKELPDMRFFIDAKTDEAAEPLVRLVERLKASKRVSIGSFDYDRLRRMLKLTQGRRQPAHYIIGRKLGQAGGGLAKLQSGGLAGVEFIHLHRSAATQKAIELIHSSGKKALVWTPNTESDIQKALQSGADGIISDRAALLKSVLSDTEA